MDGWMFGLQFNCLSVTLRGTDEREGRESASREAKRTAEEEKKEEGGPFYRSFLPLQANQSEGRGDEMQSIRPGGRAAFLPSSLSILAHENWKAGREEEGASASASMKGAR